MLKANILEPSFYILVKTIPLCEHLMDNVYVQASKSLKLLQMKMKYIIK